MKQIIDLNKRANSGFSLVTVLLFSALATLWIAAMTSAVLPVYQRAAHNITVEQMRVANEAGIDYAVDQLSTLLPQQKPCALDHATTAIPSSVIGNSQISVSVTVSQPSILPPANSVASAIYNRETCTAPFAQYWRLVTAVATSGASTRTTQVVLSPLIPPPRLTGGSPNSFLTFGSAKSSNPMLSYGAFGNSQVTLGSNTKTDGYTSIPGAPGAYSSTNMVSSDGRALALGGDVQSYGKVVLSGSVTVGGSIDVPQTNGSGVLSAQGNFFQDTVNRYVTVNGTESGFFSGFNVLGGSSSALPSDSGRTGNIETTAGETQLQLVAAPSPPPSFTDTPNSLAPISLGDISLSGSQTLTISSSASTAFTISPTGNVTIPPGNYEIGSLTMLDSSRIIVSSDVSTSQPVRFYINDVSTADDAINVASQRGIQNSTGVPSNLQIYYNGSRPINFAQKGTSGSQPGTNGPSALVYAPNAAVSLGVSSGTQVPYYGSYVGSTMQTQNVYLHYDRSLMNSSNPFSTGLSTAYSTVTQPPNGADISGLQIVNWQEL